MSTTGEREIVVGADGSAGSEAAVRWALAEAAASGRSVAVLRAWTFDPLADLESALARSYEEIASRYRHELDGSVARACPGADPARVRTGAVAGAPGPALVRASADAAMLVLGSHGHSRVLRMLVGSVSEYCLRQARCPVVIVPARSAEERGPLPDVGAARPGPLL
ncbi:universal stress protein [Amycolatopsis dendrobii]|uniref:Universal stress protein n=1 Tax=Amycolatopsis dendrobii TaxID=2760662 RepID=A0A7W3VWF0_9PSEU|nr:universal stress protein [Amycolatopsis dendrobii]MBB1154494.1 universal stress protein [Amycolatopsis dendrobii]